MRRGQLPTFKICYRNRTLLLMHLHNLGSGGE